MISSDLLTWLPAVPVSVCFAVLSYIYYIKRKRRWKIVLGLAADYHRLHLQAIRNEPGVNDRSRDIAYAMLMIVERQFRDDLRVSPGFWGVVRTHLGEKSTLASLGEIFERLFRDRAFLGDSGIDDRLVRLYLTMTSMVYRYYMLTSAAGPAALLYMDLDLLLTAVNLDRRGSSRLFRDIAGNRA